MFIIIDSSHVYHLSSYSYYPLFVCFLYICIDTLCVYFIVLVLILMLICIVIGLVLYYCYYWWKDVVSSYRSCMVPVQGMPWWNLQKCAGARSWDAVCVCWGGGNDDNNEKNIAAGKGESKKRRSSNSDKDGHGQEKRRPTTFCWRKMVRLCDSSSKSLRVVRSVWGQIETYSNTTRGGVNISNIVPVFPGVQKGDIQ